MIVHLTRKAPREIVESNWVLLVEHHHVGSGYRCGMYVRQNGDQILVHGYSSKGLYSGYLVKNPRVDSDQLADLLTTVVQELGVDQKCTWELIDKLGVVKL